jgi:transposase
MRTSYLPYEPQQQMLLPQALQDWLPEGHLVYYISDAVDSLDLSAFHAQYAGGGARNQPFHPAMMVKVLVYGYATGVFSSRKLARKLQKMWRSGYWRRATIRHTGRCATSARAI